MNIATRTGAITVALDVWHADIFDFLNIRKENIDPRLQAQDLFGQIVVNDVFLGIYEKAKKEDSRDPDWLLFCPHEYFLVTGVHIEDLWGENFAAAYEVAVTLHNGGALYNSRMVSSRELMKRILETDKETGLPYWFNKDYANATNPNKHEGIIYCSNLCTESFSTFSEQYTHVCIAEGELVLTSNGYVPIEESDGMDFYVPYSSDTDFLDNGRYIRGSLIDNGTRDIYELSLKNGSRINITDNHPVLTFDSGEYLWKNLNEINVNDSVVVDFDKNAICDSFVVNDYSSVGWILGDGWLLDYRVGACFNSNELYALEIVSSFLEKELTPFKRDKENVTSIQCDDNGVNSWSSGNKMFINSLITKYSLTLGKALDKRLPFGWNNLDKNDLANLLSGLFSADGTFCLTENSRNKPSIKLSSSSIGMMEDVKLALETLGIKSGFLGTAPSGRNKQYTLTISSSFIPLFMNRIGFSLSPEKTERYNSIKNNVDFDTYYLKYSKVSSVRYLGKSQVYDVSLSEGHHFICNGIVVHNCNLHSINLANIQDEETLESVARLSVKALNQIVSLSTSPLESTREHNDRYKIIGIGALGYHDHLVQKGIMYTKSADYAYELFEKIAYWCIDESVNEVDVIGEYDAFPGSDWENGVFFGRNVYDEDFTKTEGMRQKWIDLYEGRVRKFGMANGGLLAIAPNTGTSQLVNSSASILPVYKKYFTEKNGLMTVPFAAKYLSNKTWWLYQEAVNIDPLNVISVSQNAQQWIDQGISMELVLNSNLYNDAETLLSWYLLSMIGDGKNLKSKTVYYLRPIQKSKEEGCTSCAN